MVIGSLVTNIVADLSKWGPNLEKARGQFARFTQQVTTMQSVVAGAATAAVVGFVRTAVDQASALQDSSQKLRINVEWLQRYRFATTQAGGSSKAFDAAVSMLNRKIGNAMFGNKGAIAAFDRLGLSVGRLQSAGPQGVLQVMRAISSLPAAEQAAATMAVFGRGGQEMLPAIRNMEEFVMWMDKLKPVSADAVRGLEAVGDEMNFLSEQWKNLRTESVATFGGPLGLYMKYWQGELEGMRRFMPKNIWRDMRGFQPPPPGPKQFGAAGPPIPAGFPNNPNMMRPVQPMTPAMSGGSPSIWPKVPDIVVAQQSIDMRRGIAQLNQLVAKLPVALQNMISPKSLPAPVENFFRGIGGSIAALSNMGAGGATAMGASGFLRLTESGSADSYRQRMAIGKQNEQAKIAQKTLKENEQQTDFLEKIYNVFKAGGGSLPANLFG